MIQFTRILCSLLLCWPLGLLAQLTLELALLPENTPADSEFFVAGSFNDWQAGSTDYQLSSNDEGVPSITLDLAAGSYEYKFTRGSWPAVEGNTQGGFRPNRTIDYDGSPQTVSLIVQSWEDLGGNAGSTAADNVGVLSQSFYMPQLDRNRRIQVYLPPDYASSDHSYPVLYMHDGQNLFDVTTSFSGEWQVDESLNQLFEQGDDGIIVVGIDNGGTDRLAELTPWPNPDYGGGEGEAYIDFLVQTLKPFIDENYRTLSTPDQTGIMGSSLGGLISLYGIIRHQDVFGRAGVLSPSLWFTDDIYDYVSTTGKQADVKIYLLAGEQESASMVPDLNAMYNTLINAGFGEDELFLITHPDGQHSEWYWAREFPDAYEWLFGSLTRLQASAAMDQVRIWPIPTVDSLNFANLPEEDNSWQALVVDTWGRVLIRQALQEPRLKVTDLQAGPYYLILSNSRNDWAVFHFIKM